MIGIPILIAAYAIAFLAPVAGSFLDDGIYIVTAKSLAEGNGYRIQSLPGDPPQTKHPFLFPALLAAVWRIWPSFPENVQALKTVPLLFGFLWAWAVWLGFRDELGRTGAAWLAALTLASPWTVFLSSSLLSETLFAFLTWLALSRIRRLREEPAGWPVAFAALLTAAAFLARTSGIALIAAGILALAKAKKWKQCGIYAAVCAVCCSPWTLWQAANPAPSSPVFAYYSKANYAAWNLLANFDVGQKLSILLQNLAKAQRPSLPRCLDFPAI
ncbi:MAG: glycosyltransferase family 39 protein [Bryobacteraceae bacterium]